MATYRTKITVCTKGRMYLPGDILPADISQNDLNFLKKKRFVEIADVPSAAYEEEKAEEAEGIDAFDEIIPGTEKTAEEIMRIRSKKEVVAYAASVGLDLGDGSDMSLKDLQEAVINYQDERLDFAEEEETLEE